MDGKAGFTLVELMVVAAIVAILAVVATPAYINYVNRTKQGNGISKLLTAQAEMEEFYADNQHYASTIQCLPSFIPGGAAGQNCLANCAGCANVTTVQYYSFSVAQVTTAPYYRIAAVRAVGGTVDTLTISATTNTPTIVNPDALHWSVFQWLFQ